MTTRPANAEASYSDIGQDIHDAGFYGSVVHNATRNPLTGKPVFWFSKRVGEANLAVVDWLLQALMKAGEVYIVTYYSDGSAPISVKRYGERREATRVTRELLHEFFKAKAIVREDG